MLTTDAWVLVREDAHELHRRQRAGLSSVTDRELLTLLWSMPVRRPVPLKSLERAEIDLLRQAPTGVVEFTDSEVVRSLGSALALDCAAVVDTNIDRGLDRASAYAAFCPRVLIALSDEPIDEFLQAEANFYGIGIVVVDGRGSLAQLVAADRSSRPAGPVTWRLCERMLAESQPSIATPAA